MKELNHCPSTLADGFSTYSPTACKKLFDGQKVSHLLDFEIDEISKTYPLSIKIPLRRRSGQSLRSIPSR